MDIKGLSYFRAVAEFGTFSKAAAHLRIAQPALSRHMQKLEQELGVVLLQRTSKGMTPTAAGNRLLVRACELQDVLDIIRREMSGYAKEVTGALRVGVQHPHSLSIGPMFVASFRAAFPDVSLYVLDGFNGDLLDRLLNKQIDVAIVQSPSHTHTDFKETPLWLEKLHLVGPASTAASPLFAAGQASLEDLVELPIIMASQKHALRRLVDAAFLQHHRRFRPAIEVDGSLMIFEMVKAGLGYTLMPSSGFHPLLVHGEVATVAIHPSIFRTMSLVARTDLLAERTTTAFSDFIQAEMPNLVGKGRYGQATLLVQKAGHAAASRQRATR
jgi:LysR family nitrogen assimilation transcriptional regulator